jgi:hypothetical protein
MSTGSLNQLRCSDRLYRATIENPRAIRQWMLGCDLASFNGQTERDATHAQLGRSFGQT